MTKPTPNAKLRTWRQKAGLTRAEMAKLINLSASGIKHGLTCDEERIRRWEVGEVKWPHEPYRLAIQEVTHQDPEDLGFTPTRRSRIITEPSPNEREVEDDNVVHTADHTNLGEDENDVRRREFVGLTGAGTTFTDLEVVDLHVAGNG